MFPVLRDKLPGEILSRSVIGYGGDDGGGVLFPDLCRVQRELQIPSSQFEMDVDEFVFCEKVTEDLDNLFFTCEIVSWILTSLSKVNRYKHLKLEFLLMTIKLTMVQIMFICLFKGLH